MGAEALKNFGGYFRAAGFEDGVKGFKPFLNFYVVDAVGMRGGRSGGHIGLRKCFVGVREDFVVHNRDALLQNIRKREVRALKTYTCDKQNRIHPPGEIYAQHKEREENDGLESATTV